MAVIRYHNERRIQPLFDEKGDLVWFLGHSVWAYQDEMDSYGRFKGDYTLLYDKEGEIVGEIEQKKHTKPKVSLKSLIFSIFSAFKNLKN